MKEKRKKRYNKGFSLVELIITIAIMAVLVGMLSPSLIRYVEKAREKKDATAIGEFINELYIAASDFDNWYGISGTMVFSYDDTTESLLLTPTINGVATTNTFSQEVSNTVGGDIKLESQQWKNADLEISVNPVWDTIHVSGNLPSGYDFSNCTIEPDTP